MRVYLAACLVVVAGFFTLAHSAAAHADGISVHHVSDGPLWLHPNSPTIHSTVTDLMPTGTEFDVQCFVLGDAVSGDSAWLYGTDIATGNTGYAADVDVDTNDTRGNEAAQLPQEGIPACGSQSAAGQPVTQSLAYNRAAAVAWAIAHAQDPQTNGEECAKFVSEALWAGGLPQTPDWNNQGGYLSGATWFDGTVTANAAQPLLDYLTAHYQVGWYDLGQMSATNNDIPEAQPGDIIAYSWHGDGTIDHLAFVVGASSTDPQYPLVAEWGQFANYGPADLLSNPSSPYVERGWTWSVMNNTWLQDEPGNQNMTAYLLHFGDAIPNY